MDTSTLVAALLMGVGIIAVLRATILVATSDDGRFRGDPFITLAAGFGLIYFGQYLIR